jgi:predicted ferric reductase
MSDHVWWYVARATGIVAWALVACSVVSGLLFSTRILQGRPRPAWILDLHRMLAGTAVVFTGLHVAGIVADTYVHFSAADVLVPFASSWRPGAVALGVVAAYLLTAIEATSLAMKRMPRRVWKNVHLSSYVLFWVATFHLLTAGSDSAHPLARLATAVVSVVVVFLSLVRALESGSSERSARVGVRSHGALSR